MTRTQGLDGKRAIVTGAAGMIGAATARLMIERGAQVLAVDRPGADFQPLTSSCGEAAALRTFEADVRNEDEVRAYVEAAQAAFGGVDVFFNNAGVEGVVAPITAYPLETFQQVLAIDVVGVFMGLKHVMPVMAAQGGGSIINTSSVAGVVGSGGLCAYIASKHAVIGLTRTAAIEGAPSKIRVNSVNPGPIESRMMRSIESQADPAAPQAAHDNYAHGVPYGRYGTCEEVARLVCFLASDEAEYITGAVHMIDGGMTAT